MNLVKSNEFSLERIFQQISSKNKRVFAIQGLSEDDAPKILTQIRELNEESLNCPSWTSTAPGTKEELTQDIKSTLLTNTTPKNLKFIKKENIFTRFFKRMNVLYVSRKIKEFQPYNKEVISKTKTLLWPLLNTLSSLGLALGLPLLSVLLFRQDAIINGTILQNHASGHVEHVGALGLTFFSGMITLAVILIILGAISSVIALILNIVQNQREYRWSNANENLQKLIKSFFVLDDNFETYNKLKWYQKLWMKHKFVITKEYSFFYTEINPNDKDYQRIIESMKILNTLNNNVFFCLKDIRYVDDRIVFRNLFDNKRAKIIRFDTYKNGSNLRRIVNFMLYQVKLISGIEPRLLLKQYPYFVNSLYKFIDKSDTNEQFLESLLTLKRFVGSTNETDSFDEISIKYFVDLFSICMLKGIDNDCYLKMFSDITDYGVISDYVKRNENFEALKIDEIISENFKVYQENSIFFKLREFDYSSINLKALEYHIKEHNNNVSSDITQVLFNITNILKRRGYSIVENDLSYFDERFKSSLDNDIYLKIVNSSEINEEEINLEYIANFLKRARHDNVSNLIISIHQTNLFFEFINNQYELVLSM